MSIGFAPQNRGVDFETVEAIDIEVLGLGQGEEALEHVRCFFAQGEGAFDVMATCPAEPNYRMPDWVP